jgi:hypothetical protein
MRSAGSIAVHHAMDVVRTNVLQPSLIHSLLHFPQFPQVGEIQPRQAENTRRSAASTSDFCISLRAPSPIHFPPNPFYRRGRMPSYRPRRASQPISGGLRRR